MKALVTLLIVALLAAAGVITWLVRPSTDEAAPSAAVVEQSKSERHAVASRFANLPDAALRYEVKVNMLRQLDAESLTSQDIDTLYALLEHTPASGEEENWYVIVNEIMEQLRAQAISPDRYTSTMLSMVQSAETPEVVRDYAIQHLATWINPIATEADEPYEDTPAQVTAILSTFGEVITDPTLAHSSVPGTTLMMLADLRSGGLDASLLDPVLDTLQPWLEQSLRGTHSLSQINRISTINAIGELGLTQFTPTIRSLAINEDTHTNLRLNSIAALGALGDDSDLPSLQALANSNSKFRHAAEAALNSLSTQ